jgi:hypothetical protein
LVVQKKCWIWTQPHKSCIVKFKPGCFFFHCIWIQAWMLLGTHNTKKWKKWRMVRKKNEKKPKM